MEYSRHSAMRKFHGAAATLAVVGLAIALACGGASRVAGQEGFAGHWEGSIELPVGLGIKLDLKQEDEKWSGTIDIPLQGVEGLALDNIEVSGDQIHFEIPGVPGRPTFDGKLVEGEIRGTFTQGEASFPFRLGREGSEAARQTVVKRPQEPKPPFPYLEEEVTVKNGDVALAGTLTLPREGGPFPGVLLLTGSGPQNRNEEIVGHKPFLVLADHLTRSGIAVLRMDDRGVGGSTGSIAEATTSDLAGDALACVRYLRERSEISKDAVGVLGHSEGGMIGALAASMSKDVAFVIMLAGTGVPGEEIIYEQTRLILKADSVPEDVIKRSVDTQKKLFALLKSEPEDSTVRRKAMKLFEKQEASMGEADLDRVLTPWFRFFLTYDPRTALREVKVPVLALNGERDLQVPPDQNLPAIAEALNEGGNKDVTIKRFPGLNHLFQKCRTGSPTEYAQIEETMDPSVLKFIADWIHERF